MHSAWSAAVISGIVAAVAMAVCSVIQLISSSTPDPLPVVFIVGASAIATLVAGIFIATAVRGGLLLAHCRQLTLRFSLIIAAVNVTVLGILGTAPVETHAIKLDMPSGQTGPVEIPIIFWLTIVVALFVPVLVAYVVGRIARGRASAA
jgi:hypothetical protein